jgi:hypothetical protein
MKKDIYGFLEICFKEIHTATGQNHQSKKIIDMILNITPINLKP